ncbi:MAG: hypothetical protein ACJ72N_17910 [Labedaea sp.]
MRAMSKVALSALAAAGVGAARRISSRSAARPGDDAGRWLVVTVYLPVEKVRNRLPEPITELGDRIEVRIRPASGDKGTEVAARLREPGPSGPVARLTGRDPRQEVREALRRAKSLLETGDVLRPDPPSTHPGPGGKLVALASSRAGGEGRL